MNGHGAPAPDAGEAIEIKPADFDAFERTLDRGAERLQQRGRRRAAAAHDAGDAVLLLGGALRECGRGVVNKLSDVKLLQGDLAEAWREGDDEYATVAMRYSQVDKLIDRASGRVVEGGDTPDEGVEYWTFRRADGGAWMVSAIQQTE